MAKREDVKLVEVYNLEAATDIMEAYEQVHNYAGLFGDNGGEPDGDSYFCEETDMPDELIEKLEAAGVAERKSGWKITPYTRPNNYTNWCGFSGGYAYTTDLEIANAIFLDEASIEDANA